MRYKKLFNSISNARKICLTLYSAAITDSKSNPDQKTETEALSMETESIYIEETTDMVETTTATTSGLLLKWPIP